MCDTIRCKLFRQLLSLLAVFATFPASHARADIYQWEWVDPADHSLGRQESDTLAADGAGKDALPGAWLRDLDLTMAWLSGANLQSAYFYSSILNDADLSQANLADANIWKATLTGAILAGAEVRRANFSSVSGFTAMQLYSTASYQAGDLSGIGMGSNDLTGWSFAGKILTDASFTSATLTNTDFTGAEVRGASFLSTTDSGFTAAQLYSTASYQAGDLSGIGLGSNDLTGWNFAGKNLKGADFFDVSLIEADFSQANLTDARFGIRVWKFSRPHSMEDLFSTDFTAADTRGVMPLFTFYGTAIAGTTSLSLTPNTPLTRNTIFPDGIVYGLDIGPNETMRL